MPNWTKVLDSTAHGEDVAKRRDPNRPEVGPVDPTSLPTPSFHTKQVKPFVHVSLEV
jgi:hypothetical protein